VNRTLSVLVLVVAVGFMGCTPYQTTLTNAERSYPPTTPNNVQLFLQGERSPKATEIGEIIVLEDTQGSGIAYLQEKAAEMGADGVIDVEVKIQTRILFVLLPIPIHSYFVSGTAVKYLEISMGASQ
jgi:uncharacterized protein YbjQ (UPF0145 family)